jgi:uncharacterized membrane protein YeiH
MWANLPATGDGYGHSMVLGAAPAWFADNILLIAAITLGAVTVLIVRLVTKTATRLALLAVAAALAIFVYANRFALEECADTCSCSLAGRDVTVPVCNTDLTP